MKSVMDNKNILIIKNSKFISLLYYLKSKEEFLSKLQEARILYPNATHYCYAYIFDNEKKEFDDGEPTGTAGIPILQVLEKNELNHVLCIVVRYFGKIKLGAGGLVRAYTKSTVEVLKNHIVLLETGWFITLIFPYEQLKPIDYLLKNTTVSHKKYESKIIYQFSVCNELLEKLEKIDNVTIYRHESVYLLPSNNN